MPQKQRADSTDLASLWRDAGTKAKERAEAREKSSVEGILNVPLPHGDGPQPFRPRIFTILEYIESSWGLNMRLFPAQRFIVKLYYNIPLEDRNKSISISDMFNSKTLFQFTEREYLHYLYEEGRCNIKELDHERRELVLALGRRSGKCLKADSLVLTDKGIYRIEDLGEAPEEDFTPSTIGIVQEGGRRAQASAFYNGGVKATYTIKTASGYTETGTANHRIKVMTSEGRVDWRYLDDIHPGDFVALNRNTDLWVSDLLDLRPYYNEDGRKDVQLPEVLDERCANLLGYLVGDGTWGDDHAVSVTVEHPETWTYLTKLFNEVFGEPRVQMDKRTENTGRLEFCSVRARRFFDAIGWKLGCSRDDKMVPWAILRSPKPVVCAFLRGLFETDGSAEHNGEHITFSSASFRLAHEVQVLLLNLGIVSSIHTKWNQKLRKSYANLSIIGVQSRQRFAEYVGFDSEKKRLPMLAALEYAQECKSNTDSIPCQYGPIRDWLESTPKRNPARGELGVGRLRLREALGNTCKPSGHEYLTYSRLKRALGVAKEFGAGQVETAHFEELLRLDYFYDLVVSVEEGEDQVYDLTVPDGQSFVANGFTNHNTTLSGIFASYEVYRLLNLNNPQEYYGLPNGNRIQIISVATDKDQAGLLFNEVTTHLAKCEYFKPFIANNTQSLINFRTPYDIDKYGPTLREDAGRFVSFNGKASLRVTFKSCIAKGLRGAGNIIVILDEIAHFQDKGQSSAEEIYNAVTPSTAAFSPKNPITGLPIFGSDTNTEARVILISSPLNRTGKFFDLFHLAMSKAEGSENLLAIQAPTWEINPTVPSSYYRQKFHADPAVFMTEHGAQFSDRVRGWLEREEDLVACIDPELRPKEVGFPRYPHQMGIDVGLMNDGTAVFITHSEGEHIVVDYHEYWQAGINWRDSNPHLKEYTTEYCKILEQVSRLEFDEIAKWIIGLTKKFHISAGLFDTWNGIPLEQALLKAGLAHFRSEFFSRDQSSKMYQSAKMLLIDKKLKLYDWPKKDGEKHSPFIKELLDLQAEQLSRNIVMVGAPNAAGYHDDMSDAFIRSVWLSTERMRSTKHVYGSNPYPHSRSMATTTARYQMTRARQHGGFTQRTVPRNIGLRLGRPR